MLNEQIMEEKSGDSSGYLVSKNQDKAIVINLKRATVKACQKYP
jgi:hypothetical protein